MARTTTVSVPNTEVVTLPSTPLSGRRRLVVENTDGAISIIVGYDAEVTANTGHVITAGGRLELECADILYGIAASGTPSCIVTEME